MTFAITVRGQPAAKKTSNRIFRVRGRIVVAPSKQHEEWFAHAVLQARTAWHCAGHSAPIETPVHVRALFYRDTKRRVDLLNLEQALADLLERSGIVANDHLIRSWDGSRMVLGDEQPRVEAVITDEWTAHG